MSKRETVDAAACLVAGVALVGLAPTCAGLIGWCAGSFLLGCGAARVIGRGTSRGGRR